MKKAPPVRLSLRKLFVAMLAVGPVAILPSPLWATVPTATPFTIQNGSATWSASGATGTISVTANRSVLVWGTTASSVPTPYLGATDGTTFGNFNIAAGETYNFVQPSGGAVLNKVSVGTNATNSIFNGLGAAAAVVNGSLISNGRVLILSTSGNIIVGAGAQISTAGLVLSTLNEDASNFTFTSQGNLELNTAAASNGQIFLGSGTSAANVIGNLTAYAGAVTPNNLTVSGDLIINQNTSALGLSLSTSNPTTVGGNLSATTNNGAITKGTGALTVGNIATLNSGSANIGLGATVGATLTGLVAGSGYLTAPAVAITGGGGSGATATSNLAVVTFVITPGSGYTSAPTITFATAPVGGTTATGTAIINTTTNVLTGITITNAGSGYTTTPAVTVDSTGTGGTGAAATSTGKVAGIAITAAGSGFISNPTVTFAAAPSGGTNATATAGTIVGTSNFATLNVNTTGTATIHDLGSIILGTSTANNLNLGADNNITTSGAVAVTTNTTLASNSSGNITFANGSSTGNLTASTAAGNITANTAGNLTTLGLTTSAANDVSIITGNVLNINGVISTTANVFASGNSIAATTAGGVGSSTVTANSVTFNATGASSSIVLPRTFSRSLAVTTAGGSISQVGVGNTDVLTIGNATVNGTVTMNAGAAGNITLTANNVISGVAAANATVPANTSVVLNGNNLSLTNAGNITFSAFDAAGSVTINTAPSTFGNGTVTLGVGAGTASPVLKVAGNFTVLTNGSNVTEDVASQTNIFGAITINTIAAGFGQVANNITITGGSGFLKAPSVVITGNSGGTNATATATVNTTTTVVTGVSVTAGGGGFAAGSPVLAFVGGGTPGTAATLGATTMTGPAGNLSVGSIPIATAGATYTGAPNVVITAPAGAVTGTVNVTATATAIVTAGGLLSVNITNPGSGYTAAPTITLLGGGDGGQVAPAIGTAVIPAGAVNFTAATNQGNSTYGQWNVTAGSVNLQERTTVNLGTITATSLTANSSGGDILVNGAQTIYNAGSWSARASAGNITQFAGAINNPGGSVTVNTVNTAGFGSNLSNTGNVFGTLVITNGLVNNIVVGSSVSLNQSSVGGTNAVTNVTTLSPLNNITINSGTYNGTATFNSAGSIALTSNNATNSVVARNLVLIAADTGANSITQASDSAGPLNVNNTLTLSTGGGVNLTNKNNQSLGNVVLSNVTGVGSLINLSTRGNIALVSGSATGTVNLTSGTIAASSIPVASTITLGNLSAGNLVVSAQNGGFTGQAANLPANGAGGDIKQAAGSKLHVDNVLTAVTFNGGNIVLGNAGNNAGRVQLSTGGALPVGGVFTQTVNNGGNITYSEDATAKLGALQTSGTATITSRFGSIIEDTTANDAFNVGGLLTLAAPAGSVSLGGNTHTAGTTVSNMTSVVVTAAGSAGLFSTSNLSLGAVAANSLSVTAPSITQSAPVSIFGLSAFNATAEGGSITLTEGANNFGPLALTAARNATISITEGSTMNLRSVAMGNQTAGFAAAAGNGTLTLTSVNGDIIDTGLGGVKAGGLVAPTGTTNAGAVLSGSGVVALTATNGNIIINDPTSDFLTSAGVAFNAKDVTLAVLGSAGSTLVLGASTTASVASGNLTATSILGNIGNAGRITVGGLASFQVANGNITIDQPNVGFGTLGFTASGALGVAGRVQISESGNMDIVVGSSATGQTQLVSGGSITVLPGTGTLTFGNNVALQSSGDITLRQTQIVGTLTLSHTGTANLSLLSKSTDLNGLNPVDLGTGPYVPPNP